MHDKYIFFDVGILEHVFVWFRLFAQKMAFVNVEYLQRRIYRKPLRAMQGKLKDFLQHHDEPLWKYVC